MNLLVPVRFSCGSNLVVTQALLSCDHTSFKGHLSSTMAGLVHVFLPKAGGQQLEQEMYRNCVSVHTESSDKRAMRYDLLFAVAQYCVQLSQGYALFDIRAN
ncbi:TPA: hypothetical protein ACH3X1_000046 [Trebouxia sp. C0004]